VYSQIARELAKQYNFREINNLLKCINESGYQEEINASYDECISTCIRVFASAQSNAQATSNTTGNNVYASQQQHQQELIHGKEIEDLIHLIKDDENKINAYILNGRLKSAYLIAIRIQRADIVKHIANAAERMNQNMIKEICLKWLEKNTALLR
jgi:zinc finger FYVE domain-containing protein 26